MRITRSSARWWTANDAIGGDGNEYMTTITRETESILCARFQATIPSRVNDDAHLVWRGRHLSARCLIGIGETAFLLRIDAGRITECRTPPPLMSSYAFAIHGTADAWDRFWQSPPPPGWHDLFALSKRGEIRLEGGLHPFLSHLQYFKDVLALPRSGGST
jgi:hypothetical protein